TRRLLYEDDHAGLPSPQRSDPGCGSRPRRPRRRTRSSAVRSTRLFVRGPLWSPVLAFAAGLIPDDGFGLSAMHRCTAFRPVLLSEGSAARPPDTGRTKALCIPISPRRQRALWTIMTRATPASRSSRTGIVRTEALTRCGLYTRPGGKINGWAAPSSARHESGLFGPAAAWLEVKDQLRQFRLIHRRGGVFSRHPAAFALGVLGPGAQLDEDLQRIDAGDGGLNPPRLQPLAIAEPADGRAHDVALNARLLISLDHGRFG